MPIEKVSYVNVSFLLAVMAVARYLVFLPVSLVNAAARPCVLAVAVLHCILVLTDELRSILPFFLNVSIENDPIFKFAAIFATAGF